MRDIINIENKRKISDRQLEYLLEVLRTEGEQARDQLLYNIELVNSSKQHQVIFTPEEFLNIAVESLSTSVGELATRYQRTANTILYIRSKVVAILVYTLGKDKYGTICRLTEKQSYFVHLIDILKAEKYIPEAIHIADSIESNQDIRNFFHNYSLVGSVSKAFDEIGLSLPKAEIDLYDKYTRSYLAGKDNLDGFGVVLRRYLFTVLYHHPEGIYFIIDSLLKLNTTEISSEERIHKRYISLANGMKKRKFETELIKLLTHVSTGGKPSELGGHFYEFLSMFVFNLLSLDIEMGGWEENAYTAISSNTKDILVSIKQIES